MLSFHRRRLSVLAAIAAAAVLAAVVAVEATARPAAFAGRNGRIVFNDRTGSLVLVNPDGNGLVRLANTGTADQYIGASFSPDGQKIAYSKVGQDADIFTIRHLPRYTPTFSSDRARCGISD